MPLCRAEHALRREFIGCFFLNAARRHEPRSLPRGAKDFPRLGGLGLHCVAAFNGATRKGVARLQRSTTRGTFVGATAEMVSRIQTSAERVDAAVGRSFG